MTKKEAIAILENLKAQGKTFSSQRLALNKGIEALQLQDPKATTCKHCGVNMVSSDNNRRCNMENNDNIIMSRIAFERMQAKEERDLLWKNITIVLLIVLLVLSNGMWLYTWNQYDYVEEVVEIDTGEGTANYIGDDGDIHNGTPEY